MTATGTGEEAQALSFGTVEQALADIAAGKFIIVADDEDRENEGDLVCGAEMVTPEMVNFMLDAKGMICLAMENALADHLGLEMQVDENTEAMHTAFTVSIDAAAKYGVSTGISASDRATTIRVAVDPNSTRADLRVPGHIHPLRARDGGVLQRVGHTEAAVDLARLAGLRSAGVICEILNKDGTTARRPQLEVFAKTHGLTFITIAQLVAYRLKHERLVHRVAEARLPTGYGEWRIVGYQNDVDAREHIAIAFGDVEQGEGVLVRMHSKCLTGDTFHSMRCDCHWQLHEAMRRDITDLDAQVVRGEFKPLFEWLRTQLYSHGSRYPTGELLIQATGKPLGATAALRYLEHKYLGEITPSSAAA